MIPVNYAVFVVVLFGLLAAVCAGYHSWKYYSERDRANSLEEILERREELIRDLIKDLKFLSDKVTKLENFANIRNLDLEKENGK